MAWRGMDQGSDFSAAWRNYRRRRFVSRAVYLSYIRHHGDFPWSRTAALVPDWSRGRLFLARLEIVYGLMNLGTSCADFKGAGI
jgi:hypothetical protein